MLRKSLALAALAAVAAACPGCLLSGIVGVTPSTTPITANDSYTAIGNAKGRAWGVSIFGIPLTEPDASGRARDRAIANGGGDALIECVEQYNWLNLPYIAIIWTDCEGTAIKIKRGAVDASK